MRTTFSRHPVKLDSVYKERETTNNRVTDKTIIARHTFKEIPLVANYPAFDPAVTFKLLQESYQDKVYHVSGLLVYIQTQVQKKDQNNIIKIEQQELAKFLNVSIGTVNKAVQYMEAKSFLTKVSRSRYKVSPRLAYVGDHATWAEALEAEVTGVAVEVATEFVDYTMGDMK